MNKVQTSEVSASTTTNNNNITRNDFILINNNSYCIELGTPTISLDDKGVAACSTYLDLEFQERAPILNNIARMLEMLDVDYLFFVLNSVLGSLDMEQLQKVHDDFKMAIQMMEDNLCVNNANNYRELYDDDDENV